MKIKNNLIMKGKTMKKSMRVTSVIVMLIGICFSGSAWAQQNVSAIGNSSELVSGQSKSLVQIAILLDTSGSMSGLIDQARIELWAIVNEFIFARRNGLEPELHIALYEYGKSSQSPKDGYIRQIVPLTTDLDKVSEELFALKTNGGQEYCGWVIQEATKSLQWSNSPEDLKVIFIAGNEPFTQGPIDFRQACKDAISKGIIVNTIHCGSESDGLKGHWKDGAILADGRFLNINQNRAVAHIEAPQDRRIAQFSKKLNETYIAFGRAGQMAFQRQRLQDGNAASASKQAQVQRALTKSSFNYRNSDWDLVDALKDKKVKLEEIETEELPEDMQKMTVDQRKAYVEAKTKERVQIQQKIQHLNLERNNFIAAEMKKQQGRDNTLGTAIIKVVREQATKKKFSFESPETSSTSAEDTENSQEK